jgi:hypothetical protein
MNGDDRVLAVEFPAEHRADFGRLDVTAVGLDAPLEIGEDVFALLRPVDENLQVVRLPAERFGQGAIVLETAPALLCLLSVRGVLPEVGSRGGSLDLGQFALDAGFVKAPSAGRRLEPRGRRGRGSTHQAS